MALVTTSPMTRRDSERSEQELEWMRLLSIARKAIANKRFIQVRTDMCVPYQGHGGQPRKNFDDLAELTDSLQKIGQLNPGIARRTKDGKYEILSGERRWRAAKSIPGFKYEIFSIDLKEDRVIPYIIACAANGNTSPLKPLEMSDAIERLYEGERVPMEFVAVEIFGIKTPKARQYHRLIHLIEEARSALAEERITESEAFRLSGMSPAEQKRELGLLPISKAIGALPDPLPRRERTRSYSKPQPPVNDPLARLEAFAHKLDQSTQKLEKMLKEVDVTMVLKGKPKRQQAIRVDIFNSFDRLEKVYRKISDIKHF